MPRIVKPKAEGKHIAHEMSTLEDKVEQWHGVATSPETEIDVLKKVVCSFFRCGSYAQCRGCEQDEITVRECSAYFAANIKSHPMEVWSPEFDKIEVRTVKKRVDDIPELGLTCNTCYVSDKCPLYKQNATCGIDFEDHQYKGMPVIDMLITIQTKRVVIAEMHEAAMGGVPDNTLSVEIERLAGLQARKIDMGTSKVKIEMSSSTPSGASQQQSGQPGIIERMFANLVKKPPEQIAAPVHDPSITIEDAVTEPVPADTKKAKKKTDK